MTAEAASVVCHSPFKSKFKAVMMSPIIWRVC